MMTNAQAAILAAATQFSGAEADIAPDLVQGMAARYKGWLDRKDREDAEHAAEQLLNRCPKCYAQAGQRCIYPQRHPDRGASPCTCGIVSPMTPARLDHTAPLTY